ncbi:MULTISPECIES: 16S rRNA (cytidine(1402)-2'-O)-methyltransferase [unclassified Candidatus Tisiphia]|uniref:16S rRNA (cytidine(1402)-2'-O)-methyltransferase n=1 Tax=unclassified Candidatus Tisiphia TaxID=2996318 RepID=UPI00312C768D|nr:16S rRNA (cytidine(1402)-2'-O)-methyltransferase [Rickettsiaceae bacterium]MDD9337612.1 16S rRNA (cytidine(1402)-2'-O)-methyltransferase [Rickettsiaceae bacterium]
MIFKPGLYIVSTPIGNLDDITLRALETLKNSTIILCEDTRISRKLLAKHNIKTKLQVYNDHSDYQEREFIRTLIDNGAIVSLISDAGTPLIADPGYKLVRDLRKLNYHIDVVPGVSALTTSITISGLPSDRFLFAGFLPKTTEGKKKIFTELSNIKATLIFFETASRIEQSLHTAFTVFGNREVCVARELTKFYQEVKSGLIEDVLNFYNSNIIKGEIVLLISSASEPHKALLADDLKKFIDLYLSKGWSAKSVTDIANENFGRSYSKKEIYSIVNKIKNSSD